MPLTIADELAEEWHTPERYKEEPEPPAFRVRGLTGREQMQLRNSQCFDADDGAFTGQGLWVAASIGCIGWRNVRDTNGEDIGFSVAALGRLPMTLIAEIGNAVISRSSFSEDDRKN